MKTALLLRQQVPPDKERISFEDLSDVDDMWIHLFKKICDKLKIGHAQIWMWGGGPREVLYEYDPTLVERWWPSLPLSYKFDFIFSRGGFPEYIPVMKANSQAYKVYYGAIYKARYNPSANQDATKYNLLLADSDEQFDELRKAGYNAIKFRKPTAENIFYPRNVEKKYDVVFIGNMNQPTKGHEWFINTISRSGLTILFIGSVSLKLAALVRKLNIQADFSGYVRRKDIPNLACMAKVGVVCSEADSCPRIISEMLAMNIPVVVRKSTNLFFHKFLEDNESFIVATEENFENVLIETVKNYNRLNARGFYLDNLSLDISSELLISAIKGNVKKSLARPPTRI